MPQEFLIEGRIVRGHPGQKRPVMDDVTKKQKVNERGEPRENIFFGLAVPKEIFNTKYWPLFYNEALSVYPTGQIPPAFAYKFVDGDGPDSEGKPYSRHEGYAGHIVINFSSEGFPPPVYKQRPGSVDFDQFPSEGVNCGDFVAVTTVIKPNGNTGTRKPGLYVNPTCILFNAYGPRIVTAGVDPKEKFAGYVATLPAGASATPPMGAGPVPAAAVPHNPHGVPPAPGYAQQAPAGYTPPPAGYAPPAPQGYPPQAPQHAAPLPAPAYDYTAAAMGQPVAPVAPPGYAPQAPAGYTPPPAGYAPPAPQAAPGYPGMPAPR